MGTGLPFRGAVLTTCSSGGGKERGPCWPAELPSLGHRALGRRLLRPITVYSGDKARSAGV